MILSFWTNKELLWKTLIDLKSYWYTSNGKAYAYQLLFWYVYFNVMSMEQWDNANLFIDTEKWSEGRLMVSFRSESLNIRVNHHMALWRRYFGLGPLIKQTNSYGFISRGKSLSIEDSIPRMIFFSFFRHVIDDVLAR